jgi:hypothetical protein
MRTGKAKETGGRDTLAVIIEMRPDFARDAMRRAHGLDRVPMPLIVERGRRGALRDAHVATFTAALTAETHLTDGAGGEWPSLCGGC